METNRTNKLAFAGVLTAISASLCCITPVLALVAGSSGIASSFSWLEPARPYLIGLTVLVLLFAWYQKLKPRTAEEIACDCEDDKKPSFWQSKKFLVIITVLAIVMTAFPYYADAFFPKTELSQVSLDTPQSHYEIQISGMTCNGCEEHVKNEVSKLSGITALQVSYEEGNAIVSFDSTKTGIDSIQSAINATGYEVISANAIEPNTATE